MKVNKVVKIENRVNWEMIQNLKERKRSVKKCISIEKIVELFVKFLNFF